MIQAYVPVSYTKTTRIEKLKYFIEGSNSVKMKTWNSAGFI